jgi:hypothetical protein
MKCSLPKMSKVPIDVAEIKSVLKVAMQKIEALEQLVAVKENPDSHSISATELSTVELIDRAKKHLQWSRAKGQMMDPGNGLFSDGCWNMCLDIYICNLNEQPVTVSSIAHSSGIPMSTAMRYINVMTEQKLLQKNLNPADNRMVFISISADGMENITQILVNTPF